MKRLLLFISTLLCANVLMAQTTFWIDSLQYEVTSTNPAEVEVNEANSSITTANILEIVSYEGTDYSVTSIGNNAFELCSSLTSITIPNSVTSIGDWAFWLCSSLTSVTIPNSVTSISSSAFYNCSSLTSITIPNSVTSIANQAFAYCSSLTSVTIPNSVTSIGVAAFASCSSLTSVTIPNSVTSIGASAFNRCSSLTSIDIPNSVTSIGSWAFLYCSSLTSVILPNNANIYSDAFENTGGINVDGIYYGGKETVNIGNYTFDNVGFIKFYLNGNATTITPSEVSVIDCEESLSGDIVIPSILSYGGINYSVTSIGDYAFYDCSSLTSVDIPNSVTSIGSHAFCDCSSLTSVTIPNSVTSIGGLAFYDCDLTSVNIPNSVTSIGSQAFSLCSSLTSIDIPNSVTSIGYATFSSCSSLTSVTIPNSVTSIGEDAFRYCSSLTSVTFLGETAPSLGNNVFSSTPSTKTLTYPCGATGYSTNWGNTTWASVNEDCPALEIGEQFTIGDFTYEVTSANEVAVKTYNNNTATSTEIPSTVTYQGTTYSVTFIKGKAFCDKDNLTSVTIPNTVTAIGTLTDTYGAFENCNSLTSVTIGNNVTSIGQYAFYCCRSLTSVTIPNSVTSIGYRAFSYCDSLTSVTIGNSVTSIGGSAFEYCGRLTSIDIPNSVTSIGVSAFQYCSSLTSIDIPNSVTSIGDWAFYHCRSLTSVILPNNANISSSAFENTGGINVGGIYYGGKGTVNIGNYTFNNVGFIKFYLNGNATTITPSEVSVIDCDESLSGDIVIPSILSYEGINIAVTFIAGKAFYNKYNLTSVTIPNTVTAIGTSTDTYGAFESCDNLTSVTIPNSVTSIGKYTFFSCDNLTSVTIPNSVTSIGYSAFRYCSSLTSVTIGNSVTSIGDYTFEYCSSLDSVTCLAKTAPSFGNNVFSYTPSTKVLNIPFGSNYSSWQSATTWSKTNYLIQEGETKELSNDFTINSTTGLINEGVLRIKQSGQLINQTETNVSGIFEVETPTLANNKWSFIGAPFNNYKLEAVKPGTNDISISLFDYETGNWSNDFATIEDEVGAGEGFFAWSFAAEPEPTVFTTYGDGAEEYNFEDTPEYALNNGAVTVTKNLTTHAEGGNWLALSNPYTFKLDVNKFLSDQSDTNIKGGVVYRFNGSVWTPVSEGVINMTEGFFVNYKTEGAHSVSFSKFHRPDGAKKAETKKDYMKLLLNDGERTTRLLFAQNDKAKQGEDLFDANKLFSPLEITEPYFVTDGVALVKEEVNTLPYTANLNIRNYENKEVTISIDDIPEGVTVFLLDNGQDIKMNGGVEYTTTITAGENADRFQLLVKKQQKIERNTNNQITIKNNNRQITITSDITNLNIEVYNNLGQKVFATKDYNFTLDQLSAGSYVVKAFYGRVNQSQKIVIE